MGRKKLDPEIRIARHRERRHVSNMRYYSRTANLYPRRAWTPEEEKMVLDHSIPDSELSQKIGRSVKGIQEKRRRLKNAKEKPEQ